MAGFCDRCGPAMSAIYFISRDEPPISGKRCYARIYESLRVEFLENNYLFKSKLERNEIQYLQVYQQFINLMVYDVLS